MDDDIVAASDCHVEVGQADARAVRRKLQRCRHLRERCRLVLCQRLLLRQGVLCTVQRSVVVAQVMLLMRVLLMRVLLLVLLLLIM